MRNILIVLSMIFCATACDLYLFNKGQRSILFENRSDMDIYVADVHFNAYTPYYIWAHYWYIDNYADTQHNYAIVKANTSSNSALTGGLGGYFIGEGDTLSVYIWSYDEYWSDKYTTVEDRYEHFVKEYGILARYDVIERTIDTFGWRLWYPPTEDLLENLGGYWLQGDPVPNIDSLMNAYRNKNH